MLILLLAVAVACLFRRFAPRSQRVSLKFRWAWMPVLAALIQIVLNQHAVRDAAGSARFDLVLVSYALVGIWIFANAVKQEAVLRGPAGLIGAGWVLNTIPIVGNHGMPVSRGAYAAIGGNASTIGQGNLGKHVLATSHTFASWLGDVVAVPGPLVHNVISIGDILIMLGAMWAIQFVRLGTPQVPEIEPVSTVPSLAL